MKFLKVTASKYIGPEGYTLRKSRDGLFSIFKDNVITKWGTDFATVRSAENFLDRHDYIHASADTLPISDDDIDFIQLAYAPIFADLKLSKNTEGSYKVVVASKKKLFEDASSLICELDKLSGSIFASVTYRGTEFRGKKLDYIIAKKSKGGAGGAASRLKKGSGDYQKDERRKTPQEIARNLIRVKSSNVWAYGIEIKDRKDKVGDVYVQFKGKNGGPQDVYVYYDVPILLWRKVLSAPSKGNAVWRLLRNDFYYSKLTGDKRGKLPNAINH